MRTPIEYTNNLGNGIVTERMLCDVLYSYNKRAKNWRDKKRSLKESYAINSYAWLRTALCNEQKYYEYKKELLSLLNPVCIHQETLENEYETITQYYLFYVVGDHSFHHPLSKDEVHNYPNLKIVKINQLITKGASSDNLLSSAFCDKVRESLLNGDSRIIITNN